MRVLLFLFASAALAADPSGESLDRSWMQSVLKGDFATLDKMLAPDLVYAHATGIVDTKQSYLDKVKSGRQVYQSFHQEKLSVRNYGSTIVTHSWVRVTGTNQSGAFNDYVMMLHVWVKKGEAWMLVGHQTTKVG